MITSQIILQAQVMASVKEAEPFVNPDAIPPIDPKDPHSVNRTGELGHRSQVKAKHQETRQ